MALSAAFIGINKFSDPTIRDLTGCCRDALALWALFSDTLPNINAQLLLDDKATKAGILTALDATLGAAGVVVKLLTLPAVNFPPIYPAPSPAVMKIAKPAS